MMRVRSIDLDAAELPSEITVTMTRGEALAIATAFGRLSDRTATEQGLDPDATTSVYDALAGSVFNRFWEDGVNEARRKWSSSAPTTEGEDRA